MSQFDRAHDFLFAFHRNCAPILYRFRDSYLSKVVNFSHLACIWRPHLEWSYWNFAKFFGFRKLESLRFLCRVLFWRIIWSCV